MPRPHDARSAAQHAGDNGDEAAPDEGRPEMAPCRHCGRRVRRTEVGWAHVDQYGILTTGWLCALPHMRLAEPPTTRQAAAPVVAVESGDAAVG